ncbi:1-acyl-sn-glycerol-3-phosphate acyltransferase [uncultured Brachyspira sp.]|uniref:lysophospholipid acyltransferase family protein n=1 Tax=uncultured Brachyspira sp. TaxID=221953 RepID=UPI002622401F|nr:lysophospholipid acyltransferase family protein [uncultured Brachyspira sp.]
MILFSIFYFLISITFTLICVLVLFLFYPFVRIFSRVSAINYVHSIAKLWGSIIMRLTLASFKIEGKENYDPNKTYLLTPNHQSSFDIFCCFTIFRKSYAFVSKDTYGKVPFIGKGMSLANYIFVKRGTVGAAKSIDDMEERLKSNTSIIIYPEGTRSDSGEIKKTKRGILKIAERCPDIPVLPVVICGTRNIMKARSLKVSPFRKITIRFLKPFYFKDIEGDDNAKLDYWYDVMSKNYNELKSEK